MITIRIAGLHIGLQTDTPYILRQCSAFLTEAAPDFCVSASAQQIADERSLTNCSRSVAEFVCLYRAIAERLPDYDRFVLHGATIQLDGRAYIFTAKSGTGKSTHIGLWRQRYGAAVQIVNGDKPVLWRDGSVWRACGTPWCGKEGWTSQEDVPVAGLCLLERAKENSIRRAAGDEIAEAIFHQVYRPKDPGRLLRFLELLDDFLCKTQVWRLGCNISLEAAETAYAAMTKNAEK